MFLGYPNVGKSSVINSLKRKKSCQTGATPGHLQEMEETILHRSRVLPHSSFPWHIRRPIRVRICSFPKNVELIATLPSASPTRMEPTIQIHHQSRKSRPPEKLASDSASSKKPGKKSSCKKCKPESDRSNKDGPPSPDGRNEKWIQSRNFTPVVLPGGTLTINGGVHMK
ncbi:guanine nucleotide-binding protein-like 3 [Aphelenchoides avenae]|nr:guanine nucleotide-binding protein-like 3 [Aphelenchus avenae]